MLRLSQKVWTEIAHQISLCNLWMAWWAAATFEAAAVAFIERPFNEDQVIVCIPRTVSGILLHG
jgi:hypothetical protein